MIENDRSQSYMWTTSLVVGCVSCMHIVLFVGKNIHLKGFFNHIASQIMYNWGLNYILIVFLPNYMFCDVHVSIK